MNIITYDDIYIIKILEFGLILPAFNKKPMTRVQYDCNEQPKNHYMFVGLVAIIVPNKN